MTQSHSFTIDCPAVSIILATLNSERFLARSIESCLQQTYSDLELIVVDGGSTDGTLEIVASFDDPRIRVVHQPENSGKLPGALNLGMAASRGEYITWTQDDCFFLPRAIEIMLEYLNEHPDVALVYTDYWDVNEQGERIAYQRVGEPELVTREDVVRQTFLFRRDVYDVVGPQDVSYFPVHEVPWRAAVAARFRIEPLHVPLMDYMVHPRSLTGRIGAYQLARAMHRSLFDAGYIDGPTLTRRLARLSIDEGYAHFVFNADYRSYRTKLLGSIWKDKTSLANYGLWKLLIASVLPQRETIRKRLLAEWEATDHQKQAAWRAAALDLGEQ